MKYICYYDKKNNENRNYTLAATNKMDYIISTFNKIGINMDLISASRCLRKNKGKSRYEKLNNDNTLKLFKSIGGNKIIRAFDKLRHSFLFFNYLLFKIKKDELVLCYHSLGYYKIISLLKKIKKFKLILEVEEIYADVMENEKIRKKELEYIDLADAYIFPTNLLNNEINKSNKPYIIVHGTYKVEKQVSNKFNDSKKHIVYAGTFDPRKGVIATVNTAKFLSSNYHVHILGFGSQQQIKNVKKLIDEVKKMSYAEISYEGLKSGEEYIKFIQACDIGLSTQNPNAAFNNTSFPSKILSYMSNGLRVVSVKIPAIENSEIGKYMYYYDNQEPEEIAKAILNVDLNDDYDSRNIIHNLDEQFSKQLCKMIKSL
ncbi:MAG: glycosyltransferase [Clostridia bacterium]|nr:glycosyltransferase [Clostridia bacterium]